MKESEIEAVQIHGPDDVVDIISDEAMADREQIICLYLNTKNWPISRQTVGIGSINAAPATMTIYRDRGEFKNPNVPHYHGPIDLDHFTPYPKNPTICKFMIQIGRY